MSTMPMSTGFPVIEMDPITIDVKRPRTTRKKRKTNRKVSSVSPGFGKRIKKGIRSDQVIYREEIEK